MKTNEDDVGPMIVKSLPKGQVTIPISIRKKLGLPEYAFFKVEIRDGGIFLKPVQMESNEKRVRTFSKRDIESFLSLDKLDSFSREKLAKYLK